MDIVGSDTPDTLGSRTVRVEVFVDDPDSFIDRAVTAGAEGSIAEDDSSLTA